MVDFVEEKLEFEKDFIFMRPVPDYCYGKLIFMTIPDDFYSLLIPSVR